MKSYTDIEQSKKLAKILPIESADMYYSSGDECDICFGNGVYEEIADWLSNGTQRTADIPCWSLVALLSILHDYTLQTNPNGTVFVVCESKEPMISYAYDNSVDACYEIVIYLHELKML